MVRHLRSIPMLSGLMMLAIIVVLAGCSGKSPISPQYDQANALQSIRPLIGNPIALSDSVIADQVFEPTKADTLIIAKADAIHKFTAEAGAVKSNTDIIAKSYHGIVNGKTSVIFEFGPEGLVFDKAASLDFDLNDLKVAVTSIKLYYYDPKVNDWIYQGSAPVKNGRATVKIYHFSNYAISG